jgi:hypothetical protein
MTRKEAQMPMRCKKARVSWSPIDAVIIAQQRQYRLLFKLFPKSRKVVPAQPVDATPANRLIGQHFSQGNDLSELYSIKLKQDSIFRLY